jgi:hypothetical protein
MDLTQYNEDSGSEAGMTREGFMRKRLRENQGARDDVFQDDQVASFTMVRQPG